MDAKTRQELQSMLETTKNRLVDRLITKNDAQIYFNQLRDKMLNQLAGYHLAGQQLVRNARVNMEQAVQHSQVVETKLYSLEHELKILRQAVEQLVQLQQSQQSFTAQALRERRSAEALPAGFQYRTES